MKYVVTIIFFLTLFIAATVVAHSQVPPHHKKRGKQYDYKRIGIQKVKPFYAKR